MNHSKVPEESRVDILFVSMLSRANSEYPPFAFIMLAGFLDKHTDFSSAIVDIKIPRYKELTAQRMLVVRELHILRPRL